MNITKLGIGMADQMNARPHPSPLPRGEGDASDANQIFGCPGLFRRLTFMVARRLTTTRDSQSARTRRTFLPLLGESSSVGYYTTTDSGKIPGESRESEAI
jgi:hypothetical protein